MTKESRLRKTCVLFDLDGVIVDNLDFEHMVTSSIIRVLARKEHINVQEASCRWFQNLQNYWNHDRWHDYSFHCDIMGLGNAWQIAHLRSSYLLRRTPNIEKIISVARMIGECYIVSDATKWVVDFKLKAVGISSSLFKDIYTLSHCKTHKGSSSYWKRVDNSLKHKRQIIYIDNRLDRLEAASHTFSDAQFIWVQNQDHPISLGYFNSPKFCDDGEYMISSHERLASSILLAAELLRNNGADETS